MTDRNKKVKFQCIGIGALAFRIDELKGTHLVGMAGDIHSIEKWCEICCNQRIRLEKPEDMAENLYYNYGLRLEKVK